LTNSNELGYLTTKKFCKEIGLSYPSVKNRLDQGIIQAVKGKDKRTLYINYESESEKLAEYDPDSYVRYQGRIIHRNKGVHNGDKYEVLELNKNKDKNKNNDDNSKVKKARIDELYYKAKMTKLKYEKEAGKLVDIDKVRKKEEDIALTLQDKLLSIPERIAPLLNGNIRTYLDQDKDFESEHYVRTKLKDELKYALTEISDILTNSKDNSDKSPLEADKNEIDKNKKE